tara:strand:- start:5317 stop:9390 length:4074 start_codon:yes stop_codon:yes gene_type:complete
MTLYKIETKTLNGWEFKAYPETLKHLEFGVEDLKDFFTYLDSRKSNHPFKWVIEVKSLQFIVGVFPDEKLIRVGSKQLNYELNMLSFEGEYEEETVSHIAKIAELPLDESPMVIEYISATRGLPLFDEPEFQKVHEREKELAKELVTKLRTYKQSLFEKFSDFGLDLTANYMLIRIHLLKFLAILPNLDHDKTGDEVKRIFIETLRRLIHDSNLAEQKGLKGQKRALPNHYILAMAAMKKIAIWTPPKILAKSLRFFVSKMAKRFIAGENIQKASKSLGSLRSSGRDATIDQLGELVVSSAEADLYMERVLEVINGVNRNNIKGEKNAAGLLRSHVSIKVSALAHDFKPQDFSYTYDQVAPRLIKILSTAKKEQVFINIDAEHYHFRDIVFEVYKKVLLETEEFFDYEQTGIVVQAYLRDGIDHLYDVIELGRKRGIRMPIRLVKGAYWDAETIEADAHNFNAPQFLNKEETDLHFRQLIFKSLEASDAIILAIASHNIQDHCFSEAMREKMFPEAPVIEHQCLHMTYEALSIGLSKMNWPSRNYIPVGDLLVGMAYLVRRIMENSSQVGVLTIMRSHKKGSLFRIPIELLEDKKKDNSYVNDQALNNLTKDFRNIYPVRSYLMPQFNLVKDQLNSDLADLKSGKLFFDEGDIEVRSSSHPDLIVGKISYDNEEKVDQKIEKLFKGFNENQWSTNSVMRFGCLHKLADLMLHHRIELTSLIMIEAGKTIDEATADVDEAIDFVNFYIREQAKIEQIGEYSPRGVVGVIAPWNFPLAIPCGMTVAALVSGNCALLKPAEQTMLIAKRLVELCHEAGIPEEVVQISLGEGKVGASIVDHDLTVGIVFTGSRQVGEMIYRKISSQRTSKRYSFEPVNKFAITEMGGKNAIIVTNNCELDETVSGIIYSAFAHAGQKCSAASRIIVDNQIKDAFLARFVKAIEDIKVGPSTEFSTTVNPLISKEDALRVKAMARKSAEECRKYNGVIHIDRSHEEYDSYCVAPALFEVPAEVSLKEKTVATEEVFGPVIHIIGYDDLDQALEIFNSTEYALTGGVFCQSQDDIDYLTPRMESGNIYINRPNTGARVAIEPFGGFKMSGTGPKAGGVEYLYQFNKLNEVDANQEIRFDDSVDTEIENIAYPNKLPLERRLENIKLLIHSLINQFEVYFGIIADQEKQKLVDLLESIDNGEFNLHEREFPNRYIPGQISYNKKDMAIGQGFLIDDKDNLEIQAVLDILINLIVGNGLTVLATNEEAYAKWQEFARISYLKGISQFNFSLGKVSEKGLKVLLTKQRYHFVIFTGKFVNPDLKELIYQKGGDNGLVKILTTGFRATWDHGIDTFTHTRSFAINTMRHGAPLELTL